MALAVVVVPTVTVGGVKLTLPILCGPLGVTMFEGSDGPLVQPAALVAVTVKV